MARIFPEDRRAFLRTVASPAERTLYDRFAEWLPDEYMVLADRLFTTRKTQTRPEPTVQIDFLILHEDKGLLVLEVKGGALRVIGDNLFQVNKAGRHPTNPHRQVSNAVAALVEYLDRKLPVARKWRSHYAWAIAFPDHGRDKAILRCVEDRRHILFREAFANKEALREAVSGAFATDPGERIALEGWREDIRALTREGDLRPSLGDQLVVADERIAVDTERQSQVLRNLESHTAVCVTGPAGSGKTFLAMAKAKDLAARGRRVLLVAYSSNTTRFLGNGCRATDFIRVHSFEDIARIVGAEHLDTRVTPTGDAKWFGEDLPTALLAGATDLNESQKFDDLVIDEVFDMWPDAIDALTGLLRDEATAHVWVFGDARQGVHWGTESPIDPADPSFRHIPPVSVVRSRFDLPASDRFHHYALFTNCRNVEEIQAVLAGPFFSDGSVSLVGPGPGGIDVRTWSEPRGLREKLRFRIKQLTQDEDIAPERIVVLHGAAPRASALYEEVGEVPQLAADLNLPPGVEVSSVARFKGVDAQAVILCEMEDVPPSRSQALWYTAISRARSYLTILVQDDAGGQPPPIAEVLTRARDKAGPAAWPSARSPTAE